MARQQFNAGTDERIEADQKYLEAKQEWYEQQKELDEDYAENSRKINEKLENDIKDLQDAYEDAYESRKSEILSSMDLFEAWDSTGYDAETLIYNLKTQVAGLTLWEQQLEELGEKNISRGLLEELKAMGPDAAASIYSLNHMTEQQLDEYNKLWERRNALAESQASKDTEDMRIEANAKINQLHKDAQEELNALNEEYRAAVEELNEGMSSELGELISKAGEIGEDAVASLIDGIGKESNSVETYRMTARVVESISSQLQELEKKGKEIGKNTLDGILEGLTSQETDVASSAGILVGDIENRIASAAEIHSPSRRFRKNIGNQMKRGVILGLTDEDIEADRASREMVNEMLNAAEEEMKKHQAALLAQMALLDYSGNARINNAIADSYPANTTVRIESGNMASAMEQLGARFEVLAEEIRNMQIVLDTGQMVGALQPKMSRENAMAIVRKNRGR